MRFWRLGEWRETQAGFNLLEVLLGAMLFASVFAGLAASWMYHEQSLKKFRNRNAARHLLQQEMERITAQRYGNLENAIDNRTLWLAREIDGQEIRQEFLVSNQVVENADETLKDVVVTLEFDEKNETKRLVLRSRVFRSQ